MRRRIASDDGWSWGILRRRSKRSKRRPRRILLWVKGRVRWQSKAISCVFSSYRFEILSPSPFTSPCPCPLCAYNGIIFLTYIIRIHGTGNSIIIVTRTTEKEFWMASPHHLVHVTREAPSSWMASHQQQYGTRKLGELLFNTTHSTTYTRVQELGRWWCCRRRRRVRTILGYTLFWGGYYY